MNRIEQTFQKLKDQNRAGLNIYICAGDPDYDRSLDILCVLPDSGADFIELGMPFTDPVADGPAIQAASIRALDNGANLENTLKMLQHFRRKNNDTPVILMGYANPVFHYGYDLFCKKAAERGADALLIVDLPPEEDGALKNAAQENGLDFIKLVTPTTTENRLHKILESASGFLYYVAVAGVTGTVSAKAEDVENSIQMIKSNCSLPICIGFGIKTPQDAAEMGAIGDGVVVGSAIAQTIEKNKENEDLTTIISDQVAALRKALSSN